MGTKDFPMDTYCDQVQIDKYHAFLIFTDTRENDFKLAEKISLIDKKFFFIRTKIDKNVLAEKRSKPPGSSTDPSSADGKKVD